MTRRSLKIALVSTVLFFVSWWATVSNASAVSETEKTKPKPVRQRIVDTARSLMNTPYSFGGKGKKGVDCSGFTQNVYQKGGLKIPRTVKKQAVDPNGVWVKEPQPGDLVFFKNTYKHGLSHVGVYVGENKMIHASVNSGQVEDASLSNPYFSKRLVGFKSFVSEKPNLQTQIPTPSVVRSAERGRGSAMPFALVATGMIAGTLGGFFSDSTEMKGYFAGGGAFLVAIGMTWDFFD